MNTDKPMKPADFLRQAIAAQHQRGKENGYDNGEERSAAKIAEVFNALTGHTLSEADAWMFLIVLKLVRNSRKYQRDNIVDLVAYGSLLGECLEIETNEQAAWLQAEIKKQVDKLEVATGPAPENDRCVSCGQRIGTIHMATCQGHGHVVPSECLPSRQHGNDQ